MRSRRQGFQRCNLPARLTQCRAMILRVNGRDGSGSETPAREQWRRRMTKVVRCACGLDLHDADETRLIGRVQQHAKEAHDLDLNEEQVRAMMEIEQE